RGLRRRRRGWRNSGIQSPAGSSLRGFRRTSGLFAGLPTRAANARTASLRQGRERPRQAGGDRTPLGGRTFSQGCPWFVARRNLFGRSARATRQFSFVAIRNKRNRTIEKSRSTMKRETQ